MASKVEICNAALALLGDARITSLSEQTEPALACSVFYDISRDAVLRLTNWNFATKRASVAPDATNPTWGYDNYFSLPSDCLKLREIEDLRDYEIEGRKVAADADSINIKYTKRVIATGDFDSLFVLVLAAQLALNIAERLSASTSKKAEVKDLYKMYLLQAAGVDATEGTPDQFEEDDWNNARF